MGGLLLPRAIQLLLTRFARRWEAHHTALPPPSYQKGASSDDSVEIWVVTPPPPARLMAPPPPTCLEVASSSDDSPSDSSGYNDECPHIKEVSSYQLFSTITKCVHVYFHIQKLEKKLAIAKKDLQ
jgi:hypothetical protein